LSKRLFLLNGVAILGVVFNHAAGWGLVAMFYWAHRYLPITTPNYNQIGSLPYYVLLVVRQLTVFSVAAFLFVSGFFIAYAARGSQSTLSWKIVKARIMNLLVPYVIWSVIIFVGDYFLGIRYSLLKYLDLFFTWGATGPYYFVPLICYLYLLAPFLVPIAKTRGRLLLYIALLVQLGTMGLRYTAVFGIKAPGLSQMIHFTPDWSPPRWAFFFVFGIFCGFQFERLRPWLDRFKWRLLVAVVVLGLLAIIEPEVVYRTTGADWRFVPFPISTFLYSIALILCFLAFEKVPIPFSNIFSQLGARSYGIYLLHYKGMEFVARIIYHAVPWLLALELLYQPILLFFGLGVPLLFMWAIARSFARRYYRYLFG
jgi:peptidoglycan/LPS O-acetylase OafA/YrhL